MTKILKLQNRYHKFTEDLALEIAEKIHSFEEETGKLIAFDVILDVDYGRELKFNLGVKDEQN